LCATVIARYSAQQRERALLTPDYPKIA